LVQTIRRLRPNAKNDKDFTTNRYVLLWRPSATAVEATPPTSSNPSSSIEHLPEAKAFENEPPASEGSPDSDPLPSEPLQADPPSGSVAPSSDTPPAPLDPVLPEAEVPHPETPVPTVTVTGGLRPSCPQGEPEKTATPRGMTRVERQPKAAILKDFSLDYDLQTPPPAPSVAESLSQPVLSVTQALAPFGIRPTLILQWIHQFSEARVLEVARWILTAPKSLIRCAGGWMRQALTQAWETPSWMRQAEAQARREAQQTAQQIAEATQRAAILAAQREEAERWQWLQPHLTEYPEVVTLATERAQSDLGALAPRLCHPTSILWQQYCLQAAQGLGILPPGTPAPSPAEMP